MRYFVVPASARDTYEEALPADYRGQGLLMIAAGEINRTGKFELSGIAAFDMVDDVLFELSYICTVSAKRRSGVASSMMEYAAGVIRAMGGEKLCVGYLLDDDTYPLDALLKKTSFNLESSGRVESTDIQHIREGLSMFKSRSQGDEILPLSEISDDEWQDVCDTLLDEESPDAFMDLGSRDSYNGKLSHISFGKDGGIKGVLFISDADDGLYVDYIWSSSKNGLTSIELVKRAVAAADGSYPDDTTITYHLVSQEAADFLFGITGKKGEYKGSAVFMSRELAA